MSSPKKSNTIKKTSDEMLKKSKRVVHFKISPKTKKITPFTRSERAGLIFPVSRVERLLRQGRYAKKIYQNATIFLTSVLEYLTFEILEISLQLTHMRKKTRITPQFLNLAIFNDVELAHLFKDVTIAGAGVYPQVVEYPTRGKNKDCSSSTSKSKSKSKSKPKSPKNEQQISKKSNHNKKENEDNENEEEDTISFYSQSY